MPPSVDSPVHTQLALPVPDGVLGNGRGGSEGISSKPVNRRRIFVQTDNGSVLGIDLDRSDNVQTVKKKMQAMLNVPIEQTALTVGDTVLKSDLSELRNSSSLLLTRALQRSLSTPCIFPSGEIQIPENIGKAVEVVGGFKCCPKMNRIIKEMLKAIECGVEPVAVSGGLGGAYYFRNVRGESVAVVKPTDEEPFAPNNPKGFVGKSLGKLGFNRSVRVGETGIREVAAYLLDHGSFAKVPATVLIKVSHSVFHINSSESVNKGNFGPVAKIASCQQFVDHDFDASDHGSSRFSVAAVHRIGILDIRICNTDRHSGNILVTQARPSDGKTPRGCSNVHVSDAFELIPIDHGLCLPEALEDPYFEWLHWPQSSLPFTEEELAYIECLDEYKDVDMLRQELPMMREACLRMLILCTTLLKRAAAAGLCLAEIGEMMTRDGIEGESHLEKLCLQARLLVDRDAQNGNIIDDINDEEDDLECSAEEDSNEQFEVEMDEEDSGYVPVHGNSISPRNCQGSLCGRTPLKVLYEVYDAEEEPNSPLCSLPVKHNFWHGKIRIQDGPPFKTKSEVRSPRGTRGECSPKVRSGFCPLVEEEEVNVFTETGLKESMDSCKIGSEFPLAKSYRSVSFSNRNQRYLDCVDRKTPASETIGKPYSCANAPPLSLGDMSEEQWVRFLDHFKELLQEELVVKCNQSINHRQRLGISCQF